ncbi:molecular chaperone [Burkholderia cepacia]|uniref:fimbrial biogenesis chaperone n=1 Tax=Burkholderia cepacia TaxID=292 RepID=UPI0018B0E3FE|nr:molecular chaperone [Burkholderia cepacia]
MLLLGILSIRAHAGVVVVGTRFVMAAPQTQLSISVRNTANSPFLVSSKVVGRDERGEIGFQVAASAPDEGVLMVPFVITPPLFRLDGGRANTIRLLCTGCQYLPADRESVFGVSVAGIPAGHVVPNTVQLAVRSHFKLLYRPANLPGSPKTAYQKLRWLRRGANVEVINPTPYYITMFRVEVNDHELPAAGMVPPYGRRRESWCSAESVCNLKWRSLDDFGSVQRPWQVTLTPIAKVGQPVTLEAASAPSAESAAQGGGTFACELDGKSS